MKKILFVCITILFQFLLGLNLVNAINLGSYVINRYAEADKGKTAEFAVLLWNSEDSSFPVSLKTIEVPEPLSVFIKPQELMLDPSLAKEFTPEKDIEFVNTPLGMMKAKKIKVFVNVPSLTEFGEYSLLIKVTVGKPDSGVSTLIEKTFRLKVNVTPYVPKTTTPTTIETESLEEQRPFYGNITGMITTASADPCVILLVSVVIGILVVFSVIYKYA